MTQARRELYGEPTRTRNKDYLKKRLAWRIQELAEGGLSQGTLARIHQLGDQMPEPWPRHLHAQVDDWPDLTCPPRSRRIAAAGCERSVQARLPWCFEDAKESVLRSQRDLVIGDEALLEVAGSRFRDPA